MTQTIKYELAAPYYTTHYTRFLVMPIGQYSILQYSDTSNTKTTVLN